MKISVIGAGNVGATCAMRLLESGIADIVLLDKYEGVAKGKAEDLMDAASIIKHNRSIFGTGNYKDTAGSDIVIITAGFPRMPGMTREELLLKNASIVNEVAENITKFSKDTIIIVVTNPLDIMAYIAYKKSGLDRAKVIGMAGVLDCSRMNLLTSRILDRPLANVDSLVLGTHGQTMVPAISQSALDNKPMEKSADTNQIKNIIEKTKERGAEIVAYLGTGSAFYAPSAGVFKMVKAIIENSEEILPCSCLLKGEYGFNNIYLGVPVKLGKRGVREIVELNISSEEKDLLARAAESVRKQLAIVCMI